jgi:hypothetical protein
VQRQQEIIARILMQHELFRHGRRLAQFSVDPVPQAPMTRSIEPLEIRVALVVRAEIARRNAV